MADISLPLLPKSIAVGLNDNLLQYSIELKFLLLFFEKPLAILSSTGFNFISEETVEAVKKGKQARTNAFDENNLLHILLLGTEEWDEIMAQCEPYYNSTLLSNDNEIEANELDEYYARVDGIFADRGPLGKYSTSQLSKIFGSDDSRINDEIKEMIFQEYMTRIEMYRLVDILDSCRDRQIPMIWGVDTDIHIVDIYAEYLIKTYAKNENNKDFRNAMRLMQGHKLLREIFQLGITNVATVPVAKIVDFRKTNTDLLTSFLTKYRGFLVDLQSEPHKVDLIAEKHSQLILEEMDLLRKELLLLRREKQYSWLRRMSDSIYEGANKGAYAAIWSLLMNPVLLLGEIGKVFALSALKLSNDLVTEKEKEDALLFRCSSGYLWKAHEQFNE